MALPVSNIPVARDILKDVAYELSRTGKHEMADRVCQAIAMMTRASPVRRAPVKNAPLTETQQRAVRAFVTLHPDIHLSEVAQVFGVNQGRISEALRNGP